MRFPDRLLGRAFASVLAVLALAAASFGENPKGAAYEKPATAKSFPVTATLQMRPATNPMLALRGRVVLLTIIETHNSQCAAAVPDLNALHDRLGPRGLTILALAHEEEKDVVEKWLQTTGLKTAAVIVDTAPFEKIVQREYAAPGYPWSFLIDANGTLLRHEHPMGIQDQWIDPLLDATTQPPLLPASLEEAQKQLDAGTWAKARETLLAAAAAGTLSKPDAGWAKGVARWIDLRRSKTIGEGEALEKQAWWWDAWWTYDDYTRRFEGLEGCDVARQKADAIRANKDPAVEQDLKWGDEIVKAKEYLAKGTKQGNDSARLILQRLAKLKARFADRARELLETVPAK